MISNKKLSAKFLAVLVSSTVLFPGFSGAVEVINEGMPDAQILAGPAAGGGAALAMPLDSDLSNTGPIQLSLFNDAKINSAAQDAAAKKEAVGAQRQEAPARLEKIRSVMKKLIPTEDQPKQNETSKSALPNSARAKLAQLSQDGSQAANVFDAGVSPSLSKTGAVIVRLPEEGISMGWVRKMRRKNRLLPAAVKRLQEAVRRVGFSQVALNQDIIAKHSNSYTKTLPDGTITDQKQSGRCWIFAGLNMIRSTLLAEGRLPKNFEFSENHIYFYSLLEKSNRYFEQTIKTVLKQMSGAGLSPRKFREEVAVGGKIDDGGWFEHFAFLVEKYGLVPKGAMEETISSASSAVLLSEINDALAIYAAKLLKMQDQPIEVVSAESAKLKEEARTRVWERLTAHLGAPVSSFEFREDGKPVESGGVSSSPAKIKRHTPLQFARNFVRFNARDYVVVANSDRQKKGAVYEVDNSAIAAVKKGRPAYNVRFLDAGAKRMGELTDASIDGGHPVWFASDVLRDVDYKSGIMHLLIYLRDAIYGSSRSERKEKLSRKKATYLLVSDPDHAMLADGYDRPNPEKPTVKRRVVNSWGDLFGFKGIFHMYSGWFRENVYEVIIHKKFLSEEERKAWEGKAKEIVSEEDMF